MHPGGQMRREQPVHHPVASHPALPGKGLRADFHPVVGFPARPRARMPGVLLRFVDHLQMRGRKTLGKAKTPTDITMDDPQPSPTGVGRLQSRQHQWMLFTD